MPTPLRDRITSLWLIEDDEPYRHAIARVVNNTEGLQCVKEFSSCIEALTALKDGDPPDVILTDIGLPGMSGIEGVRQVKEISPSTHAIMVTVFQDDEKVFQAICAGASGYMLKTASAGEIVAAIRTVLDGGAPMNARIARKVLDMFAGRHAPISNYDLTPRETEILHLLVDGLSMKQVAARTFLSYHTVDSHIRNIYGKLNAHTRAEAVRIAMTENL